MQHLTSHVVINHKIFGLEQLQLRTHGQSFLNSSQFCSGAPQTLKIIDFLESWKTVFGPKRWLAEKMNGPTSIEWRHQVTKTTKMTTDILNENGAELIDIRDSTVFEIVWEAEKWLKIEVIRYLRWDWQINVMASKVMEISYGTGHTEFQNTLDISTYIIKSHSSKADASHFISGTQAKLLAAS